MTRTRAEGTPKSLQRRQRSPGERGEGVTLRGKKSGRLRHRDGRRGWGEGDEVQLCRLSESDVG